MSCVKPAAMIPSAAWLSRQVTTSSEMPRICLSWMRIRSTTCAIVSNVRMWDCKLPVWNANGSCDACPWIENQKHLLGKCIQPPTPNCDRDATASAPANILVRKGIHNGAAGGSPSESYSCTLLERQLMKLAHANWMDEAALTNSLHDVYRST